MKKLVLFALSLLTFTVVRAEEETTPKEKPDLAKISEAFGHMIAQNLDSLGLEFDMDKVLMGLRNSLDGKTSPLSDEETVAAITQIQEDAFQKKSDLNLIEAEEYLATNAQKDAVVTVDDGKLQYEIEKEGTGEIVQAHFNPLITYKGTFVDGKEFGESKEPEALNLDETIPGFSKGIIGMKEGEKRRLFIHPELGYGTQGFLPPNSLLIFDIEVVKANAPQTEDTLSSADSEENSDEIALSDLDEVPAVR